MTHAPAARYKVDATPFTAVAICLVAGCGARWLTTSRDTGLVILAAHIERAHPGYENVPAKRVRTAA